MLLVLMLVFMMYFAHLVFSSKVHIVFWSQCILIIFMMSFGHILFFLLNFEKSNENSN